MSSLYQQLSLPRVVERSQSRFCPALNQSISPPRDAREGGVGRRGESEAHGGETISATNRPTFTCPTAQGNTE